MLTPSGNTHCSGGAPTKPVAVMAWVPRSTCPCPPVSTTRPTCVTSTRRWNGYAFALCHLVVSAGFGTWKDDPLGTFRLTADGIGAIGAALADLALPTVIVQEGGYALRALGDLAMRFLRPFS